MAEKKKEREAEKSEVSKPEAAAVPAAVPAAAAEPAAAVEVSIQDETANSAYANFARVTGTPEEVIFDFGLNPNPFAGGKQTVRVLQRLIMSYYTAKRLLGALQVTVQRHEKAFGAVEVDVRRRAEGGR